MGADVAHDDAKETGEAGLAGPTMQKFMETCWGREPLKMAILQGGGITCCLISVWICAQHARSLRAASKSLRRGLYMQMAMLPAVLAIIALLSLLCPSSKSLLLLIHKIYEAFILYSFGVLIFILVMAESIVQTADSEKVVPGEEHEGVHIIQEALAAQGPKKHFGVPPLGCCWRPCMQAHDLSLGHLYWVHMMIRQFSLVMPTVAAAQLYLLTVMHLKAWLQARDALNWLAKVANLVCIYGLMILYFATHSLLHRWNTHRKFVSIKVVLIIVIWQEFLVGLISRPFIRGSDSCFRHAGWTGRLIGHEDIWEEFEVYFYSSVVLALESTPMALLIRRAFPKDELQVSIREVHHDVLQLSIEEKSSTPSVATGGSTKLEVSLDASAKDVTVPKELRPVVPSEGEPTPAVDGSTTSVREASSWCSALFVRLRPCA